MDTTTGQFRQQEMEMAALMTLHRLRPRIEDPPPQLFLKKNKVK